LATAKGGKNGEPFREWELKIGDVGGRGGDCVHSAVQKVHNSIRVEHQKKKLKKDKTRKLEGNMLPYWMAPKTGKKKNLVSSAREV